MRLGGPIFETILDPFDWVASVKKTGYRAVYCPVPVDAEDDLVQEFSRAANDSDIVIAEVGSWCNPLSPDDSVRNAAIEKCKLSLDLADRIGARCCVNIAGSRGTKWDGPHPDDLTRDTFEMIVEVTRDIIDAVKPVRTFYTLETMPWMYPDSADSYLELIRAIDRNAFGVHLDPVNLICSPQLYFQNGALIKDFISRLGPQIRSCHAKDILLQDRLTVHLDEVRPGLGRLDYPVYMREINRLDRDIPLMIEHLKSTDDYLLAAEYIRSVGNSIQISL